MTKEVYVFDLDGTLVDSMKYFERGMLAVADELGLEYDSETIKIITPLGYRGSAEYYVNTLGAKCSVDDIVKKFERNLYLEYSENIKLKAGVFDYITKLHARGARLFVLTASPHLVTDVCLKRNGVFDLFEEVWSVDDFRLTKSGTTLFFKVCERIGCGASDVHYFDDSLIALKNATLAGYDTYGVYDRQTFDELKSIRLGLAKHLVMTFEEMSV